jgi:conjugative relaxase-like TrwC/TraI family protein
LHRLPALEKGLQTARNFGGAIVTGIHAYAKLKEVYGENMAMTLASLARTKLILGTADRETATWCSDFIGHRQVATWKKGYTYGYNNARDAVSLTPRKHIEPLLLPDQLMNLPRLSGYIKFPDGFPAAPVDLMLSVANVRTAGGAANYFAADNYYTRADAERSGQWLGKGAETLGLRGVIEASQFEAVLKGMLPDGSRVGTDNRAHRAGTDLAFSMPKSWSILALVGGDRRILDAYGAAVRETLTWAEKNLAETRMDVRGKERVVATRNLVIGLFQHDTNRNQEPNAHFHAVVANVTQGPDGKWRALRNDKLWEHNTLLNAMTMARFRLAVEKLGYQVGEYGKHGNFEAVGVPKPVRDAFSSRRAEILDKLSTMESKGIAARNAANLMTRADKGPVADRQALVNQWREAAAQLDFDPRLVIAQANARAATDIGSVSGIGNSVRSIGQRARLLAATFAERLELRQGDPLVPRDMGRRTPEQIAAVHAVASAIRHLGEREAAFSRTEIYRSALGFALPTTLTDIEHRVDQLLRQGHLQKGRGADRNLVTTRDAIGLEQRIIAAVESGRGHGAAVVEADVAGERLQALSQLKYGLTLNHGQEGAGRLLLASHNRIVAIQGVAGAGKSTVLKPVADILREEGKSVLGLAVQNTLVQMLERDTGIPSMTVARFLRQHPGLLEGADQARLAEARANSARHHSAARRSLDGRQCRQGKAGAPRQSARTRPLREHRGQEAIGRGRCG